MCHQALPKVFAGKGTEMTDTEKQRSLRTEEGFYSWDSYNRDFVKNLVESSGSLMPMASILCTEDPRDGSIFADLGNVVMAFSGNFDEPGPKNMFSNLIRMTSLAGKAHAVAFMSEIWTIHPDHMPGKEEFQKFNEEWGGRYGEHPHKIEGVMVSAEHPEYGNVLSRAPMIRNPDDENDVSIGEWDTVYIAKNDPAAGASGRFVDLVPPKDILEAPNCEKMVAMARKLIALGGFKFSVTPGDEIISATVH
jgi:hypothetical protein